MKKFVALAVLACVSPAFADVKLLVDENIKVTAINGKEIRHGALQPLKREFNLQAGRHVITARYDRIFELTREHDYLKSANITLTATLDDNQTYKLVMPNQPNSYASAKEYIKSPSLAIMQGDAIIAEENTTERQGILPSLGIGLSNVFRDNDATLANQQTIASLQTQAPETKPAETKSKDNLDGFMQLWLNSNEEEREKIRQWIQK